MHPSHKIDWRCEAQAGRKLCSTQSLRGPGSWCLIALLSPRILSSSVRSKPVAILSIFQLTEKRKQGHLRQKISL